MWLALVTAWLAAAGVVLQDGPGDLPAPTAGELARAAVLEFEIVDEGGIPVAGRLTFVGPDGPGANLFPNAEASPNELAVRSNVIYTLSGRARVTVPPGAYTVYASRGLEWSVERVELDLAPEGRHRQSFRLRREVDTTGWISGDFHLHTLTHSGHGDANLKERLISIIAEGLEFAVATDHNHHTDYEPTLRELGGVGRLTTVTGNEVSTPIGHMNAFPLEPGRPVPDPQARDANVLFKLIRATPNRFGVVPIIQLNHPRWGEIDYFGKAGLDPVAGTPTSSAYSADFDTIELLNENAGWGYEDADVARDVPVGASRHSVVRDWFNLLNRGRRYAAVGNSDSHHVYRCYAGYPRNFVRSPTDDPGAISPADVAAALRDRETFTTLGPFVTFEVNGRPMGGRVAAAEGGVELHVRVQAASWIDCDRVKVVFNGDVVDTIDVPAPRAVVRLDARRRVPVPHDGWLVLLVEGDDPLAPVVHDTDRPVRPVAVTNPVWIDAEGDRVWLSPWEQALRLVRGVGGEAALEASDAFRRAGPSERALIVLAAQREGRPFAVGLAIRALEGGLAGPTERWVRLAGARAAESLATAGAAGHEPLLAALERTWESAGDDAYLRIALLRGLRACGQRVESGERALALARGDSVAARRYRSELLPLVPGRFVEEWSVVGYFPNPARGTLREVAYGPESDAAATSYAGKDGRPVEWRAVRANARGYLDLRSIDRRKEAYDNAIAYAQTYVHSPDERSVRIAIGSDDGCRLVVNGEVVLDDDARHAADPFAHVVEARLRAGWNRLLVKVENGGGDFGLYCRVLDDAVAYAPRPPED